MNRQIKGTALSVWIIILGLAGCCLAYSYGATTIYIPDQFPTIQQGIDAAASGDTVLVRDGIYKLTAPLDFKGKAITVISQNGVNNCFLDGQNSTRVVYFHSGEGYQSVLSGFTIRNGRAAQGAGVFCDSSSPTITNCTIIGNTAYTYGDWGGTNRSYGGGISCNASSAKISDCVISGNHADSGNSSYMGSESLGGGVHLNGGSPILSNCTIAGNTATAASNIYGSGISIVGSSPSITSSTISNNSGSAGGNVQGGGVYSSNSVPSLVNCVINANSAKMGGGIYFADSSAFSNLTNSTIVRNTASTNGGALYCANTSPKIINSILWEDSPQEVYKDTASNPTITYSDVYGSYAGTGNINALPLFVNTAQQDFHLTANSPCIDTGSNAAPYLPLQDMDGNARINGAAVDMGAYEYSSTILLLNNNRFKVQVDWQITSGQTGHGTAVNLTSDSGYFWFFSGNNVELLIKILDGRGVNNHYWFFWGAMTDVQYTITVTDTQTGAIKTYHGIQGVQQSGNDINAF
jgi:predicted outer membrane repeat protein